MSIVVEKDSKSRQEGAVILGLDGEFVRKVACFLSIGGGITVSHYVVLIACVNGFGINPVLASSSGYAVASVLNYYLNSKITFRYAKGHGPALVKFLVVAAVGLWLNAAIMHLCIAYFALHYLIAQGVATIIVFTWNFSGNYMWSFR